MFQKIEDEYYNKLPGVLTLSCVNCNKFAPNLYRERIFFDLFATGYVRGVIGEKEAVQKSI